jgi:hypothetical protein
MKSLKWLIIIYVADFVNATPTPQMCDAFAKFAARWNPIPETLPAWTKDNCDKIQPRPSDMSCEDVAKFVSDCNYGHGGPQLTQQEQQAYNRLLSEQYYQRYYGWNRPKVLPRYTHWNRQTAYDFGQYGNWYYPNYYPGVYVNDFGSLDSARRLENEYAWARGSHFPYNRADNVVNIGLQQTSLPACLHDIFFCVRAAAMKRKEKEQRRRPYYVHEIGPQG